MFTKINQEMLRKTLLRLGIAPQIDAANCVKYAKECLEEQFGKKFSTYAEPVYLKNSILVIKVQSSLIAEEVQKKETEIISYLGRKNIQIKRIRFIS